ncbi:MAG: gliding motility-associated C-terminal domain-containing protein [Saprospiraceae bacterium]|nr:gliding motility-associated C-terminal domain-containing protein [Saprospiraceae bacterium]
MNFKISILFLFFLGILAPGRLWATHNRAGEITYEQIGDLTIRVTIVTYTRIQGAEVDRQQLGLYWGDGQVDSLPRINGPLARGEELLNNVKKNIYIGEHTYPGPATYTLVTLDPNRTAGILNVDPPNSVNVPFALETTFTLLSTQFQGYNSSPRLLQPPIDYACLSERFIHNPNAFDPDGDSLAYELIVPLQGPDMEVPNYKFPNEISPGPENQIDINEITGDFIWNAPQRVGEYNIAIKIYEYREGILINTTVRDMQIFVQDCNNQPPEIETITDLCVIAGDTVRIPVRVTDPNNANPNLDRVQLTALGGPFEQDLSPAYIEGPAGYVDQPLNATLVWPTLCDHVSNRDYTVVFRAVDDDLDTTGLANLKSVRIRVIAPAPQDLQIEPQSGGLLLSWEKPYACDLTIEDYFRGFSIWRKLNSATFAPDTCNPGLAGRGYTQIGYDVLTMDNGRYVFLDQDLEKGKTYCYRIQAEFARLSNGGYTFNRTPSLPSEEVCAQLVRDVPFILNVSVENTDPQQGQMYVRWTKPVATDLDTIIHPGPYTFELMRADGISGSNYSLVQRWSTPFLGSFRDTIWMDSSLNTTLPYTYKIVFYTGGNAMAFGESQPASSVYLSVTGKDKSNLLMWDFSVPWSNYQYVIYKQFGQTFDSLTTVSGRSYTDMDQIENGQDYCYVVKAQGTYGIPGFPPVLDNYSQIQCAVPFDSIAPCPPQVSVDNICSQALPSTPAEQFINTLTWQVPLSGCDRERDFASYRIYFAASKTGSFELVGEVSAAGKLEFKHKPESGIAGCYAVTSLDSAGNESEFSTIQCVDNCPDFLLPNTFTPNGDGHNDLYMPITYRFITRIEMRIFNRWGGLVFETTDPQINWDGTSTSGKTLAEGVYYYTCKVFDTATATNPDNSELLTGYIHLIRGD